MEDCGNGVKGHGYCSKHYQRWKKFGDANLVTLKVRPICSVEGCNEPHYGKNFCRLHYQRWKENGHTDKILPPPTKFCTFEGCTKEHCAKGLCETHYKRYKIHGDPNVELVGRGVFKKCGVEICQDKVRVRGYCEKHYLRLKNHGDPNYEPPPPTNLGKDGYRQITINGKQYKEHRIVMETHIGRKLYPRKMSIIKTVFAMTIELKILKYGILLNHPGKG
jgi:hypothetical protein